MKYISYLYRLYSDDWPPLLQDTGPLDVPGMIPCYIPWHNRYIDFVTHPFYLLRIRCTATCSCECLSP
ncbi:hypothetical protein BDV41DRAFT_545667 [Aspergillus transmontanensis]|uniref:Uncharacterized protein n=1 Tax=Aspergillus transmontanensis TaxID=1034304 RepID=A0A5N6VP05_9EURO|nr:hypothetical protein BDV41DRAFT_545667 [Aspergillus transmontanensis]